jgi:hypothetical protein
MATLEALEVVQQATRVALTAVEQAQLDKGMQEVTWLIQSHGLEAAAAGLAQPPTAEMELRERLLI